MRRQLEDRPQRRQPRRVKVDRAVADEIHWLLAAGEEAYEVARRLKARRVPVPTGFSGWSAHVVKRVRSETPPPVRSAGEVAGTS